MSTIKIEHVNPITGKPVAFDILGRDSDDVRDTFVLNHGQSKIMDLSGGLVLREVSVAEIAERERLAREEQENAAAFMRLRKAEEDAAHIARVAAEQAERQAEIDRLAADKPPADPAAGDTKPDPKPDPVA